MVQSFPIQPTTAVQCRDLLAPISIDLLDDDLLDDDLLDGHARPGLEINARPFPAAVSKGVRLNGGCPAR
jgi:hypothetical protein